MLRLYSIPYEWGIDADFKGETRTLFSEFRRKGAEGSVAVTLFNAAELRLSGGKGTIDTPGGFRGVPNSHAQEWNADTGNWRTDIRATIASRIAILLSYGRETIPGELGLWYNGSRYMRGKYDIGTHRFHMEVRGEDVSRAVPAVRFDRASTDFDISHGVADSWPFTPGQMEIIGDKTWTFSGTGRFVSDSVTGTWNIAAGSWFSTALHRVYPDYRILVTTRDHLSIEPWDMLFGRRRTETDRTRFYDFASVSYRKEFILKRFKVAAGIQQLIPLRHAGRKIPGKAPAPPSFPKLKIERLKRYGGLEVWAGVKYFLR